RDGERQRRLADLGHPDDEHVGHGHVGLLQHGLRAGWYSCVRRSTSATMAKTMWPAGTNGAEVARMTMPTPSRFTPFSSTLTYFTAIWSPGNRHIVAYRSACQPASVSAWQSSSEMGSPHVTMRSSRHSNS